MLWSALYKAVTSGCTPRNPWVQPWMNTQQCPSDRRPADKFSYLWLSTKAARLLDRIRCRQIHPPYPETVTQDKETRIFLHGTASCIPYDRIEIRDATISYTPSPSRSGACCRHLQEPLLWRWKTIEPVVCACAHVAPHETAWHGPLPLLKVYILMQSCLMIRHVPRCAPNGDSSSALFGGKFSQAAAGKGIGKSTIEQGHLHACMHACMDTTTGHRHTEQNRFCSPIDRSIGRSVLPLARPRE
jgi:hypothetical protein